MASSTLSPGDTYLGDPEPSKDNGIMPEGIGSKPPDNGTNMEDNGSNAEDNGTTLDNKAMNTRTHAVDDIIIAKADGKEMALEPVVKVDMPGLRLEGVKVEIGDDGWLSISGERKEEVDETDKSNRADRGSGEFIRSFNLPNGDMTTLTAKVDSGRVTVIVANDDTREAFLENMRKNKIEKMVEPMPRSKLKWKETAAEHVFIADLPENVDMENLAMKVNSEQLTVTVPKRLKRPREPEVAVASVDIGSKPADNGSKPADDGSKPADDGSKPADDGSKPADDGSKPGDNRTLEDYGFKSEDNGTKLAANLTKFDSEAVEALYNVEIPREDWIETAIEHVLKVDIPCLSTGAVNVWFNGDDCLLSICGTRREEEVKKTDKRQRKDPESGRFMRTFELPKYVNMDKMTAKMDCGMLTVIVPKDETRRSMLEGKATNTKTNAIHAMPSTEVYWKDSAAEHVFISDLAENADMENSKNPEPLNDNGTNMEDDGTDLEDIVKKPDDNRTTLDNKAMNTKTHSVKDTVIARVDGKEMAIEPVVKVDMPGLRLEGVKVEIGEDGWLSISGQRKEEEVEETDKSNRAGRGNGYYRTFNLFNLPECVDMNNNLPQCMVMNKVVANLNPLDSGLLTVIAGNNETREVLLKDLWQHRFMKRVEPIPRSKLKWKETVAEHVFIANLPENVDMENLTTKVTSKQLTVIVPKEVKRRREPEVAVTSVNGSSQLQSNTEGAEKTPGGASGS